MRQRLGTAPAGRPPRPRRFASWPGRERFCRAFRITRTKGRFGPFKQGQHRIAIACAAQILGLLLAAPASAAASICSRFFLLRLPVRVPPERPAAAHQEEHHTRPAANCTLCRFRCSRASASLTARSRSAVRKRSSTPARYAATASATALPSANRSAANGARHLFATATSSASAPHASRRTRHSLKSAAPASRMVSCTVPPRNGGRPVSTAARIPPSREHVGRKTARQRLRRGPVPGRAHVRG